jgi:hypothetical protein
VQGTSGQVVIRKLKPPEILASEGALAVDATYFARKLCVNKELAVESILVFNLFGNVVI